LKDWIGGEEYKPLGEVSRYMYQDCFVENFLKIRKTTLESPQLSNSIYYTIFTTYSLDFLMEKIPKLLNQSEQIELKDEKSTTALGILLSEISKISLNSSYKKFIGRLSIGDHLDPDILEYISILFGKDIYLVDSNGKLFKSNRPYIFKGLPSIIITFKEGGGDYIYQSVGRINSNGVVEYEFGSEDSLIRQIRQY
jgi:hypothetical protein